MIRVLASLKHCYVLSLVLAVLIPSNATAARIPYTPKITDPAEEARFWSEIEELKDKGFRSMANGPEGTVFFGTEQGAYRYDGYHFKHYGTDSGLDGNPVISLYMSKSGKLYAITAVALYILEHDRWLKLIDGSFNYQRHAGFTEDPNGIVWTRSYNGVLKIESDKATLMLKSPLAIAGIAADKSGTLWITLIDHDVLYECLQPTAIANLQQHCQQHRPIKHKELRPFPLVDSKNRLWFFTKQPGLGIYRFDIAKRSWRHIDVENINGTALETADGSIFFTSEKRLYKYADNQWQLLRELDIGGASLLETPNGRLLVGSVSEKVYSVNRSHKDFAIFKDLLYQDQDSNGVHWFLGANGGIISHDSRNKFWERHYDPDNIIETPVALLAARNGRIIVAGSEKENAAISIFNGNSWQKHIIKNFSPAVYFTSLFQAADDTIYMSGSLYNLKNTSYSGGVLKLRFMPTDELKIERLTSPNVPNVVHSFAQTADSSTWLVEKRLYKLDRDKAIPIDNPDSFRPGKLLQAASSGDGNIWLARFAYGLFAYNGTDWTHYPTKTTTGTNAITYILPVDGGRLYAATFNGIVYFDGETWNRNFLPDTFKMRRRGGTINQDSTGALWLSYSSVFWFLKSITDRGAKNVNIPPSHTVRYMPDSLPPIVEIEESTQQIPYGGNQSISWNGHDKWNVTPSKLILYSYRLNNGNWSPFTEQTRITLSALKDGEHNFYVRAKDAAGNVSLTEAHTQFIILPPIWKQAWFLATICGLLLIIVALIALIIRLREEHLIALDKIRLDFYTNITHELRTPLTIILGPLEKLKELALNSEQSELVELASKSAHRLQQLVDQILNIRKVETNNDPLNLEYGEPIQFLKELSTYYLPLMHEKNLQFKQSLSNTIAFAEFDKDKLQKIVDNLMTNAIKYTPKAGQITLQAAINNMFADSKKGILTIKVEDTGYGIDPSQQKNIFSRYYRTNAVNGQTGFGIGLAHAKKLVDVCNGDISLSSPIDRVNNTGTCFTVTIPLELSEQQAHKALPPALIETPPFAEEYDDTPLLLIIEDNLDIRNYLKLELGNRYAIIEAGDGLEGVAAARKYVPDIIISDIMMPELDGLECCKLLKANPITSHIPIIVLTARRSRDHELAGWETGVDDYIYKPIDIKLLKLRIFKRLTSRTEGHRQLEAHLSTNLDLVGANKTDKDFVSKLIKLIETQMGDPEFDIMQLPSQMGFSRTTLYRKIKALFGQSPTQFMNTVRLEKASILLKSKEHTVSEVADLVGYRTLSYFSRLFKAEYKQAPSEYHQKYL